MTKPDTPFPRHWLYYIVLKYGVLAVAVVFCMAVESIYERAKQYAKDC